MFSTFDSDSLPLLLSEANLPESDSEPGLALLAAGDGLILHPGQAGHLLQLKLQALVLPRQLLQPELSVL